MLGVELNRVDTMPQRFQVVLVPSPTRVDTAPSNESLPSNGIAQLTQGPSHPSAGGIITWENGEITSSGRRWLG
jgi:hypothetical protein